MFVGTGIGIPARELTNAELEKLLPEIFKGQMALKVGLVAKPDGGGDAGSAPKESKDKDGNIIFDNDVDLAYVASVHEFGDESRNIPQRSFLRSTYNENDDRIAKLLTIELKQQAAQNTYNPEAVLRKIGVWFVGEVKGKFTSNGWPPLKDPFRGGRNFEGDATPLVDTGQLRASIDYELVKKLGGPT